MDVSPVLCNWLMIKLHGGGCPTMHQRQTGPFSADMASYCFAGFDSALLRKCAAVFRRLPIFAARHCTVLDKVKHVIIVLMPHINSTKQCG
eukprot:350494-Chlamydomonas_euryale.AAC.7